MNVVQNLLQPKFDIPSDEHTTLHKQWKQTQEKLLNAFLNQKGVHTDEINNYNSYLNEIVQLLKQHVQLNYIDSKDQRHYIRLENIQFVLPYEERVGIDNPETALLRNHYEAKVYATVLYSIYAKPFVDSDMDIEDNAFYDQSSEEDDEKHHDAFFSNEDDDEDDDDEEADDDDEENEYDEFNEEDEEDDDDNDDEEPQEEEEEEEDNKSNVLDKTEIQTDKVMSGKAFFIQKKDYSEFSERVYHAQDRHHILNFPVWLQSDLCIMSTPMRLPSLYSKPYLKNGCTYIVNRNFKLCPYEEYYINNHIISNKPDSIEMRCSFHKIPKKRFRTNSTLKFNLEKRNFRKNKNWQKPFRFMIEIPFEEKKKFCPVSVFALAYGWPPQNFIAAVRMFLRNKHSPELDMFLRILGYDVEGCRTQEEAIRRVSKCLTKCKKMENKTDIASYVSYELRVEYMPNLIELDDDGDDNNDHVRENLRKGYALAEAVAELIQLSDLINDKRPDHEKWTVDDKRSYVKKRLDTPGRKMASLARKYITHYSKTGQSKLRKDVENGKPIELRNILNNKTIKLTNSVKNGIWDSKSDPKDCNLNKTQMMVTGFCSDSMHTETSKIVKFAMKRNSNPEPLLTEPTQLGRVDPYRTPETERCGSIRNKALGCHITSLVDYEHVMKTILRIIEVYKEELQFIPLERLPNFPSPDYTILKDVYGGVFGWTKKPFRLYQLFLQYRRRNAIYDMLAVVWDRKRDIIYFNCDPGRLMRPLIIMEKFLQLVNVSTLPEFVYHNNPVQYLIENGFVEYLDPAEEYCGVVFTAASLQETLESNCIHTHMEIHGCLSLTMTVSKAFCNFNQGPRRMYTGNMENRSIGLKLYEDRGTRSSYSLWYGQDPLLSDPVDQAIGMRHDEPNGFNVRLAILSDDNIEDSYCMKREAFDRGMCVSTETSIQTASLGVNNVFQKPDAQTKGKAPKHKYDHLNDNGTPKINAQLHGGDAVIGKIFMKKNKHSCKKRCDSKFLPWNTSYKVKSVATYPANPVRPPKIIRTSMYKVNEPLVGNKFYLAHGQKGTMSRRMNAVDMPWIAHGPDAGVSPDLMINVASLSRITQGLLLESLMGTARAFNPSLVHQYETVFLSEIDFQEKLELCCLILKRHGLNYNGKVHMRMGTTGELIQSQIFTGIVHLRVLKHMASDKLRSRDRGPTNELTRQTSVGKKRYGGLKQGEMENWNLHSYGMPSVFQNINQESADNFLLYVCTNCDNFALGCIESRFFFCKTCESSDHIVRIPNTYITNLCIQEMETAGFGHALICEPIQEELDLLEDEQAMFVKQQQEEEEKKG